MNVIIKLFNKIIEKESSDSFLILEAGTNHYELADLKGISIFEAAIIMIQSAKDGKADAIKFQAYYADKTASKKYAHDQYKYMRRRDILSIDDYKKLIKKGKKIGIPVFFSFFDLNIIKQLGNDVELFKVASPDITNFSLLKVINEFKKPVILSTAGAASCEIKDAIDILKDCEVAIMYCRAIYPTPDEKLDLGIIKTLNKMFPNNVIGWSSHSINPAIAIPALALGANVFEFHYKINDEIKGGDYLVSINTSKVKKIKEEFYKFKEIYGNLEYRMISEENPLRKKGRRGLYAVRNLSIGTRVDINDFIALRPATIKGLNIVQANNNYNFSAIVIKETIMEGEPLTIESMKIVND